MIEREEVIIDDEGVAYRRGDVVFLCTKDKTFKGRITSIDELSFKLDCSEKYKGKFCNILYLDVQGIRRMHEDA